jgi:shikimate dehydrogenase
MPLYGLIGYPLGHSFSKKYFTEKFEREGWADHHYETFPLASIGELPALLAAQPDLAGLNVTIPYKEAVIPFLHQLSPVVKETGACNCIHIINGELHGHNTDVIGFERSLLRLWQPAQQRALILGSGGAAKAVQYVLTKNNIRWQTVSRNATAGALSYAALTPAHIHENLLLINTTPLGMYPHTDTAPPIPYEAITPQHYLFDLVYNPTETVFLQKGKAQGATVQNGGEMLQIQAEESWRIWREEE